MSVWYQISFIGVWNIIKWFIVVFWKIMDNRFRRKSHITQLGLGFDLGLGSRTNILALTANCISCLLLLCLPSVACLANVQQSCSDTCQINIFINPLHIIGVFTSVWSLFISVVMCGCLYVCCCYNPWFTDYCTVICIVVLVVSLFLIFCYMTDIVSVIGECVLTHKCVVQCMIDISRDFI